MKNVLLKPALRSELASLQRSYRLLIRVTVLDVLISIKLDNFSKDIAKHPANGRFCRMQRRSDVLKQIRQIGRIKPDIILDKDELIIDFITQNQSNHSLHGLSPLKDYFKPWVPYVGPPGDRGCISRAQTSVKGLRSKLLYL
ncbi:hypothetical protein EVAR_2882_1 [Eumeta japonica]|uniref:Uncharacterized protein n=1 Tax=Eumeta variegata TaxID=151549 RepID=A0A4C1T1M5_EUMVA|nr:hypothetical protein EVAR_2882_1 [Eumeta japonica]